MPGGMIRSFFLSLQRRDPGLVASTAGIR